MGESADRVRQGDMVVMRACLGVFHDVASMSSRCIDDSMNKLGKENGGWTLSPALLPCSYPMCREGRSKSPHAHYVRQGNMVVTRSCFQIGFQVIH